MKTSAPRAVLLLTCLTLVSLVHSVSAADSQERPNVVWIVSEDNSLHYLRHFFPGGAEAPHIEQLAAEGLTFDHAYSNAPVCSVARTTLATGCYAPKLGTQFHRKSTPATLPPGLQLFPAYLKDAGYYTTNNSKTDYNTKTDIKTVWHDSSKKASWRNRPDTSMPFFHMESHAASHESSLHFPARDIDEKPTTHGPASVSVPDYLPDTKETRYTVARYLDRMQVIDDIVGKTVAKLEADGLLESTFVFYFGDHGGVLPRSKGYAYDSGLHVPLVVRIPEKFRHLVEIGKPGDRMSGCVSFVDFGPTVLHLAGLKVPELMDGRPFLGAKVVRNDVESRDESFGYADRFDEKSDFVRSLHKGRFHYLRCYQPFLPDGLQNNYRYKMVAFERWRELYKRGELQPPQTAFFEPKPVEMLFDTEADPHEVRNLAGNPRYKRTLSTMRERLSEIVTRLPDLSFYPESHLVKQMDAPYRFGVEHAGQIMTLDAIARLATIPYKDAEPLLKKHLASKVQWERYWACMVCSSFGSEAESLVDDVSKLLNDPEPAVRLRAIEFLGLTGKLDPGPPLVELVNTIDNAVLAGEALGSLVYFLDHTDKTTRDALAKLKPQTRNDTVNRRLEYLRVGQKPQPPKRKKNATRK